MKQFEKYKGIHPGIILDRELKKRSIKQRPFALSLDEHPQTLNAILNGKRSLTTSLALKIEKKLEFQEGTLVLLQAHFDIKKTKEKESKLSPELSIVSKSLFWDTDISKIDWEKQHRAVIQRVYERGNDIEKEEINRFYGTLKVQQALKAAKKRRKYTLYDLDK